MHSVRCIGSNISKRGSIQQVMQIHEPYANVEHSVGRVRPVSYFYLARVNAYIWSVLPSNASSDSIVPRFVGQSPTALSVGFSLVSKRDSRLVTAYETAAKRCGPAKHVMDSDLAKSRVWYTFSLFTVSPSERRRWPRFLVAKICLIIAITFLYCWRT